MVRVTNVRDRVHQTFTVKRLFVFHGYSVTIDLRHLSSIDACKRTMRHFAGRNVWWLVGQIYAALLAGSLPEHNSDD